MIYLYDILLIWKAKSNVSSVKALHQREDLLFHIGSTPEHFYILICI